jgi:serine/threonine protein kinase
MHPTEGYPSGLSTSAEEPAVIGRYRLLKELGAGGMGTVYRALDPQLNREVALKLPHFSGPRENQAARLQRFQREAQAAARVRHPHVCPIYDVGEWQGKPFVVMAHIEGESLAQRLARSGGRLPDQEALELVRQVLDALEAIHGHGIVHRDLKPANILLDADGRALVTDFGLARSTEDREPLTSEGVALGTPGYMAPEQALGRLEAIGPWTDLYSVGAMLYQMVTGRMPFEGPAVAVLASVAHENPPPPSSLRPELDRGLESVIVKAMAREPRGRFQNARQFSQALSRSAGLPVTLDDSATRPTVSLDAATPRARVEHWRWILFSVIALLALGVAGYYGVATLLHQPPSLPPDLAPAQSTPDAEADPAAQEAELQKKLGADALAQVRRSGQAIVERAYPFANVVGGVTYTNAWLESVVKVENGHEAMVRLNYSNAVGGHYYFEILVSYDAQGKLRSWRVGRYNDPFPPGLLKKTFDQWPN